MVASGIEVATCRRNGSNTMCGRNTRTFGVLYRILQPGMKHFRILHRRSLPRPYHNDDTHLVLKEPTAKGTAAIRVTTPRLAAGGFDIVVPFTSCMRKRWGNTRESQNFLVEKSGTFYSPELCRFSASVLQSNSKYARKFLRRRFLHETQWKKLRETSRSFAGSYIKTSFIAWPSRVRLHAKVAQRQYHEHQDYQYWTQNQRLDNRHCCSYKGHHDDQHKPGHTPTTQQPQT